MTSTEEEVVDIFGRCGIIENIVQNMETNEKIKLLEEEARKRRPPTARITEPLTKFLSKEKAQELQRLRERKKNIKTQEEKSFECASIRIKEKGIKLIPTKKGIFATKIRK